LPGQAGCNTDGIATIRSIDMANEPTTRTTSRDAGEVRTRSASSAPKSDTTPRHPDDPKGYNPQAPGHTRFPSGGRLPVIAVVIGVVLVATTVLYLIFGNGGLHDESAPADPTEATDTAPPTTVAPTTQNPPDPAPASGATDPGAAGTADPAPAAPPTGN